MSKHFYLYVDPEELAGKHDEIMVVAHYMIGYCPQTITEYAKMAATLRETFPQAKDNELGCHRITKSSRHYGHTLISWQGKMSRKKLGVPDAKGYAALIKKMKASPLDSMREHPALPEYKGWYITAYRIAYNY